MATCMQHIYMIPEARKTILEAPCSIENKHEATLIEIKKMFAYLLVSSVTFFYSSLVVSRWQ